ncbi:hypothetical protein LguiB_020839 [Lonicera macranthoides]
MEKIIMKIKYLGRGVFLHYIEIEEPRSGFRSSSVLLIFWPPRPNFILSLSHGLKLTVFISIQLLRK